MAEVDTSVYRNLGQQDPLRTPLQVMQLLSAVNQNKLFNQTYGSREKIGEAYRNNVGPDGKVNYPGLSRDLGQAGFLAGEALGQSTANSTSQFELEKAHRKSVQDVLGTLADMPNLNRASVISKALGAWKGTNVPPEMFSNIISELPEDPKKLREYLVTQGNLARGVGATGAGVAGTPGEGGEPIQIPEGQAAYERRGIRPVPGRGAPSGGIAEPTTGMRTGVPAGFTEAANVSAGRYAGDASRSANFGADIYPMTQALGSLERLGTTGTGPGTDELNVFKSFIQSNASWLPGADKIIGDPEKIKDFDEAKKYLTNIAGGRAAAFGHGTDQALSTALTASPNTHISNLAAVDLTKATLALRRMDQAQFLDAEANGVQPHQYTKYAAKWAVGQDPRAYMVDLMTPEQLSRVRKSLKTDAEKKKFLDSYNSAVANGLISRPAGEHRAGE